MLADTRAEPDAPEAARGPPPGRRPGARVGAGALPGRVRPAAGRPRRRGRAGRGARHRGRPGAGGDRRGARGARRARRPPSRPRPHRGADAGGRGLRGRADAAPLLRDPGRGHPRRRAGRDRGRGAPVGARAAGGVRRRRGAASWRGGSARPESSVPAQHEARQHRDGEQGAGAHAHEGPEAARPVGQGADEQAEDGARARDRQTRPEEVDVALLHGAIISRLPVGDRRRDRLVLVGLRPPHPAVPAPVGRGGRHGDQAEQREPAHQPALLGHRARAAAGRPGDRRHAERERDRRVVLEGQAADPGPRVPPHLPPPEAREPVGRVEDEPEVVPADREGHVGREHHDLGRDRPVLAVAEGQLEDHERQRGHEEVVAGQRLAAADGAVEPARRPPGAEPGGQPQGPAVAALDLDLDQREPERQRADDADADGVVHPAAAASWASTAASAGPLPGRGAPPRASRCSGRPRRTRRWRRAVACGA